MLVFSEFHYIIRGNIPFSQKRIEVQCLSPSQDASVFNLHPSLYMAHWEH